MLPTYTIEGLDWLGWLGLALMIAAAAATWIWYRRKKAKGFDNGLEGPYPIDGFADCHYAEGLQEWESKLFTLVDIRDNVMAHCAVVYGSIERWIVPKVVLVHDTLSKAHPNIYWSRASDRIVLKIQDDMYWHFAGEVHNVHRFGMYGPGSDKSTYSPQDKKDAAAIQAWIAERYKEG